MDYKRYSLKRIPYSSNSLRYSLKEFIITVLAVLLIMLFVIPLCYRSIEEYEFNDNFRLAEKYRDDYWSYSAWAREAAQKYDYLFFGDSVVWGMYVDNDNTLSAQLNELLGENKAANMAIDGLHQVALKQLINSYAGSVQDRKVFVYFNPLWLNTPLYDLTETELDPDKPFKPNHPRLLPQMDWSVRAYDENFSSRVSIALEHHIPLYSLLHHLRLNFYDNQGLPDYIVANPEENPFTRIDTELDVAEKRKRNARRSWRDQRLPIQDWPWVAPQNSRQWAAFKELLNLLKERNNQVSVLLGPINQDMMTEASQERYNNLLKQLENELLSGNIVDEVLVLTPPDSALFADASHPLKDGYKQMAEEIYTKSKLIEREHKDSDND